MSSQKPNSRDVQLAADRLRQTMAATAVSQLPPAQQPSANPYSPASPTAIGGAGPPTGGNDRAGVPARERSTDRPPGAGASRGQSREQRQPVPVDPPPKSAFRRGRDRQRSSGGAGDNGVGEGEGGLPAIPQNGGSGAPPPVGNGAGREAAQGATRPAAPPGPAPAAAPTIPQPAQSPPRERSTRSTRPPGPVAVSVAPVRPLPVTIVASPTSASPTSPREAPVNPAPPSLADPPPSRKRDLQGRRHSSRRPGLPAGSSPPLPSLPSANSLRAMSPPPPATAAGNGGGNLQPPEYDPASPHTSQPFSNAGSNTTNVRLVSGGAPPGWPTSPDPLPPMERYPDGYFPMPDVGPVAAVAAGYAVGNGMGNGGYQPVGTGPVSPPRAQRRQYQPYEPYDPHLPHNQGQGQGQAPPHPLPQPPYPSQPQQQQPQQGRKQEKKQRSIFAAAASAFLNRPKDPSPLQQVETANATSPTSPTSPPAVGAPPAAGDAVPGGWPTGANPPGTLPPAGAQPPPRSPRRRQPTQPSSEKPNSVKTANSAPASPGSGKRPSSGGILSLLRGTPPDPKLPPTDGDKTVEERMEHTMDLAEHTYNMQVWLERFYSFGINFTILLQLLFAAAITVLSAVPGNHSIPTAVLGALTTLLAGLLARYRGTNQPERAGAHATAMRTFLAECEAFIDDYGDKAGPQFDAKINELRMKYEVIEENAEKAANGVMHAGYTVQATGTATAKFHS